MVFPDELLFLESEIALQERLATLMRRTVNVINEAPLFDQAIYGECHVLKTVSTRVHYISLATCILS